MSTGFVFKDSDDAAAKFALKAFGPIYTRITNPTADAVEKKIAALEGGMAALAVSCGHSAQLLAFSNIMTENTNRAWWVSNGKTILTQLLIKADKDPKDFLLSFEDVLEYLSEEGIETQVMDELSSRNVKCMNFYDICLDYILIDSFEDLEAPPSSVLAVMKNRWLSNSFKESALQTALWSVFQAKRRLLQFPNGFKARFYNVSEILTPTLAWAFFGPDEELGAMVNEFKDQVLGFLKDIFSFHSADYNTVESLSASVMSLARARLETIKRKLGCSDTGAGDS